MFHLSSTEAITAIGQSAANAQSQNVNLNNSLEQLGNQQKSLGNGGVTAIQVIAILATVISVVMPIASQFKIIQSLGSLQSLTVAVTSITLATVAAVNYNYAKADQKTAQQYYSNLQGLQSAITQVNTINTQASSTVTQLSNQNTQQSQTLALIQSNLCLFSFTPANNTYDISNITKSSDSLFNTLNTFSMPGLTVSGSAKFYLNPSVTALSLFEDYLLSLNSNNDLTPQGSTSTIPNMSMEAVDTIPFFGAATSLTVNDIQSTTVNYSSRFGALVTQINSMKENQQTVPYSAYTSILEIFNDIQTVYGLFTKYLSNNPTSSFASFLTYTRNTVVSFASNNNSFFDSTQPNALIGSDITKLAGQLSNLSDSTATAFNSAKSDFTTTLSNAVNSYNSNTDQTSTDCLNSCNQSIKSSKTTDTDILNTSQFVTISNFLNRIIEYQTLITSTNQIFPTFSSTITKGILQVLQDPTLQINEEFKISNFSTANIAGAISNFNQYLSSNPQVVTSLASLISSYFSQTYSINLQTLSQSTVETFVNNITTYLTANTNNLNQLSLIISNYLSYITNSTIQVDLSSITSVQGTINRLFSNLLSQNIDFTAIYNAFLSFFNQSQIDFSNSNQVANLIQLSSVFLTGSILNNLSSAISTAITGSTIEIPLLFSNFSYNGVQEYFSNLVAGSNLISTSLASKFTFDNTNFYSLNTSNISCLLPTETIISSQDLQTKMTQSQIVFSTLAKFLTILAPYYSNTVNASAFINQPILKNIQLTNIQTGQQWNPTTDQTYEISNLNTATDLKDLSSVWENQLSNAYQALTTTGWISLFFANTQYLGGTIFDTVLTNNEVTTVLNQSLPSLLNTLQNGKLVYDSMKALKASNLDKQINFMGTTYPMEVSNVSLNTRQANFAQSINVEVSHDQRLDQFYYTDSNARKLTHFLLTSQNKTYVISTSPLKGVQFTNFANANNLFPQTNTYYIKFSSMDNSQAVSTLIFSVLDNTNTVVGLLTFQGTNTTMLQISNWINGKSNDFYNTLDPTSLFTTLASGKYRCTININNNADIIKTWQAFSIPTKEIYYCAIDPWNLKWALNQNEAQSITMNNNQTCYTLSTNLINSTNQNFMNLTNGKIIIPGYVLSNNNQILQSKWTTTNTGQLNNFLVTNSIGYLGTQTNGLYEVYDSNDNLIGTFDGQYFYNNQIISLNYITIKDLYNNTKYILFNTPDQLVLEDFSNTIGCNQMDVLGFLVGTQVLDLNSNTIGTINNRTYTPNDYSSYKYLSTLMNSGVNFNLAKINNSWTDIWASNLIGGLTTVTQNLPISTNVSYQQSTIKVSIPSSARTSQYFQTGTNTDYLAYLIFGSTLVLGVANDGYSDYTAKLLAYNSSIDQLKLQNDQYQIFNGSALGTLSFSGVTDPSGANSLSLAVRNFLQMIYLPPVTNVPTITANLNNGKYCNKSYKHFSFKIFHSLSLFPIIGYLFISR